MLLCALFPPLAGHSLPVSKKNFVPLTGLLTFFPTFFRSVAAKGKRAPLFCCLAFLQNIRQPDIPAQQIREPSWRQAAPAAPAPVCQDWPKSPSKLTEAGELQRIVHMQSPLLILHDVGRLQYSQMTGYCGHIRAHKLLKFGHAQRPVRQSLRHEQTTRMTECLEYSGLGFNVSAARTLHGKNSHPSLLLSGFICIVCKICKENFRCQAFSLRSFSTERPSYSHFRHFPSYCALQKSVTVSAPQAKGTEDHVKKRPSRSSILTKLNFSGGTSCSENSLPSLWEPPCCSPAL